MQIPSIHLKAQAAAGKLILANLSALHLSLVLRGEKEEDEKSEGVV